MSNKKQIVLSNEAVEMLEQLVQTSINKTGRGTNSSVVEAAIRRSYEEGKQQ